MSTHPGLSCDQARLALSARLDGEPLGVPADRLDAHLATCAGCADWLARAEQLTRAYTPIAVVLAVCLTATSGLDIGEHRVTVLHEIGGHWGTIIQAGLIFALGRLHSPSPRSQDRHNFREIVASEGA